MKKKLGFLLATFVAVLTLSACAPQVNENGVPNSLKEKYSGYSKVYGYDPDIFSDGGSEIVFDKKENKITNTTTNDSKYFKVFPEDELSSKAKAILTKEKSEVEGKQYFIIGVGNDKKNISDSILYGIVLSNGGNTIRIFEFETGNSDTYYDFSGEAQN